MWTVDPMTGLVIAIVSVGVASTVALPIAEKIIQWRDRHDRSRHPHQPAE